MQPNDVAARVAAHHAGMRGELLDPSGPKLDAWTEGRWSVPPS